MDFVGIWHYACCARISFIENGKAEIEKKEEKKTQAESAMAESTLKSLF